MAKLRNVKGTLAGFITINLSTPELFSRPTIGKVLLTKVVTPFDMTKSPVNGWPTQLCAASLLWSSPVMGVVVKDKDGLFHAIETNQTRVPLGAVISFDKEQTKSFEVVEFVSVPTIEFKGAKQRALSSPNQCFVAKSIETYQPASTVGKRTAQKIKSGVAAWRAWHRRFVATARAKPPAPPEHISKPFVEVISALFGFPESNVRVLQDPDERISDSISLDLFKAGGALGHGGSTMEDIIARLRNSKVKQLTVNLKIEAQVFSNGIPLLSIVSTGIHEGAHYRHYAFTRQLIDRWHQIKRSPKLLSESQARREFLTFIHKLKGSRDGISKNEFTIVESTFRVTSATHPLAQFHAFMGIYSSYPRERDMANKKRTLTLRPRFEQLLKGTDDWRSVGRPNISDLCVEALAQFARQAGQCVVTDIRELYEEFEGSHNHGAQKFYKKLKPVLAKD